MAEAKSAAPAPGPAPATAPRKRGRPRTVTDDQQVPERRRKQLRVAQQAYRRRKETTITNLQARVQELESGIEELSESFLSFSNLLLEEDLFNKHPLVASALQKITQQCVSLAKRSCDEAEQASPVAIVDTPATETPRKASMTPQPINMDFNPDMMQFDPFPIMNDPNQSSLISFAQWPMSQLPPTPPYQEQAVLPFGIVLSGPTVPFSTPSPPMSSPPETVTPTHLVKQERWTLSHRLVRECCERGYRLLVDTPGNDTRIQEIFGRRLTNLERNRLVSGFYAAMNDEVGDMIELRSTVLSPLRSKNINSRQQLALSSRTWQIIIESGDNEWLDASGVQNFLLERGIRIYDIGLGQSSPRLEGPPQFNATAFIRILALSTMCVGRGPTFRRRDVENALQYATTGSPWSFSLMQ